MADDEQFSLCWNNFNSNLSAGFHESLCRGDLVDVTLAAEGQLVKAHRLVLSVCSPYFRKMFTQMPANQHAFVFLKDVSHAALKDLIQFMYCGEVNVKQDALPAFISTAEALQIKGLTETGDSTPAPQAQAQPTPPSPVKEMPPLVASTPITLVQQTTAPRPQTHRITPQRQRQQSYKTIDSEGSSDEKVIIHHQQQTQQQVVSQKRPAPKILSPVSAPALKRAKQQQQIVHQTAKSTSDPLEAPTPIHITVSQAASVAGSMVSQQHALETKSIASDTEFIDLPIETINPKSEPEYEEVEDDQADNQHEQLQHEMEHESETEQDQQYADDNQSAYGSIKYDESYFTTTEQTSAAEEKAGASGMSISGVNESYATETGEPSSAAEAQDVAIPDTALDESFSGLLRSAKTEKKFASGMSEIRARYSIPLKPVENVVTARPTMSQVNAITVVGHNPQTIVKIPLYADSEIRKDMIRRQLSNGHALIEAMGNLSNYCLACRANDPEAELEKIKTFCVACPAVSWSCAECFDENHDLYKWD